MTRDEIKMILMRIQSAFPNWKPTADLKFVVDTWCEYLIEYTYEHIAVALKIYIATDTSGFAPSIGHLIQKANSLTGSGELNEIEAWTLVGKALRNGYYGAEEEFSKLPPIVQKAVGSPAQLRMWATTDEKSIETVVSSNFMRTYKAEVKREEEYKKLPESVKKIIRGIEVQDERKGIEER